VIARIFCILLSLGCLLALYALGSGLRDAFHSGVIKPRGIEISKAQDGLMYRFYVAFYIFGLVLMAALLATLSLLIVINPF